MRLSPAQSLTSYQLRRSSMNITHNKETDTFEIHISVPRMQSGTYTYDEDSTWEEYNVCVWINEKHEDYSLNYTQYLDYKDSLQATSAIVHFDTKEEAEAIAREHNLPVKYSRF